MNSSNVNTVKPPATSLPRLASDRLLGGLSSAKIQSEHLERLAVVYVRQSSAHQLIDHQESKARQYLLGDYAVRLGWLRERVLVIDEDQGISATTTDGRFGFQRLLAEVSMDHVGMILGLEMSRLARSDKDWHQLLEVCAIFRTVLADQDGVYDPSDPNDRLLLGLKGTMSTLELHTMRNRLEKGRLFKAERGELFCDLPVGYVKLPSGGIAFDPDEQAQSVVRLIFEKFMELGAVRSVFTYLLRHAVRIGIRPNSGPNRGRLEWRRPRLGVLYSMLHHPFYAGAYAYGRRPIDPKLIQSGQSRSGRRSVPMEQWKVLIKDCLPAYITWEQYLRNQEQIRQNRSSWETPGTPRQGSALLSGLLICGCCGVKMSTYYSNPRGRYECRREHHEGRKRTCRGLATSAVDALVTQQALCALLPASLELSLRASKDIQRERDRQTQHWQQQLERVRYDVHQAERCYRAVDPENRLVARTLEQQWEQSLRQERQLEEEYDRFMQHRASVSSPDDEERIRALASDVPALWHASATTMADRKTVIRCLIDRIVVNVQNDTEFVDVSIYWEGGFDSHHQVQRPVLKYEQLRDYDLLVNRLRELREAHYSAAQIAEQLNQDGFYTPQIRPFNKAVVRQLLSRLRIVSEHPANVEFGPDEWWSRQLGKELGMPYSTLQHWINRGWVKFRKTPDAGFRILWADQKELERLRRLYEYTKSRNRGPSSAKSKPIKSRSTCQQNKKRRQRT